jgi:hypothetical protein
MRFPLILALLALSFSNGARANGLSDLKSYPVWFAARTCHALTGFCATEFQVFGDERHQGTQSCHNVAKAVDVFGSHACLIAWATCLSTVNLANPVLYCYAYGAGVGQMLNFFDSNKCNRSDHTNHLHLQPLFGCHNQ